MVPTPTLILTCTTPYFPISLIYDILLYYYVCMYVCMYVCIYLLLFYLCIYFYLYC